MPAGIPPHHRRPSYGFEIWTFRRSRARAVAPRGVALDGHPRQRTVEPPWEPPVGVSWRSSIAAGTSSIRTDRRVEEHGTGEADAEELTMRSLSPMKLPNTTTMMAAAAVITPCRGRQPIGRVLSPVRTYSS